MKLPQQYQWIEILWTIGQTLLTTSLTVIGRNTKQLHDDYNSMLYAMEADINDMNETQESTMGWKKRHKIHPQKN